MLRVFSKIFRTKASVLKGDATPLQSFYQLTAKRADGQSFSFDQLRGKKVLIVNTATECGYTAQLASLVTLKNRLPNIEILAFPSNDFKNQEPGNDASIASFCTVQYGINYPLFAKSVVKENEMRNPVFEWLCNPSLNGWNNRSPVWNFCKYVVDENGRLTHFFEQGVDPLDNSIIQAMS